MNFKPGDIIELEKNSDICRYRILLVLSLEIEDARIKTLVLKASTKHIKENDTLRISNYNTRYYRKRA